MNRFKLFPLLALAPLLMAIQCEDDLPEPQFAFNTYKVSISSASSYTLNDTIWITGRVSSNVLDLTTNDSVFGIEPNTDVFGIFKFIEPTDVSNCEDAIDAFELILDAGDTSRIPVCENADLVVSPLLDLDESFYAYRIGLRPEIPRDYVISLRNASLQNANRHEAIGDSYAIPNFPNQIGFSRCGMPSWRFLDSSSREYYFTVE